ncbi:hypothetical protein [Jiella sp. M17.18]|uniref:hypothetical protein n=1 Tax=Jiella sp. M17.18 TaxID=3234247 RepID=UPI0034DE6724
MSNAATVPEAEARDSHPWLARAVFGLDRYLRKANNVIEYTDRPDCIFRIQPSRLERRLELVDGTVVEQGAPILELHLWSEQVPVFPPGGAKLSWARQMAAALDGSLQELAGFLARERRFDDVVAVRANMAFATPAEAAQSLRICGRYGFTAVKNVKVPSRAERLHIFGENILIGLMIIGRNSGAFRLDSLLRSRTEVVLTRAELERRYPQGAQAAAGTVPDGQEPAERPQEAHGA